MSWLIRPVLAIRQSRPIRNHWRRCKPINPHGKVYAGNSSNCILVALMEPLAARVFQLRPIRMPPRIRDLPLRLVIMALDLRRIATGNGPRICILKSRRSLIKRLVKWLILSPLMSQRRPSSFSPLIMAITQALTAWLPAKRPCIRRPYICL